MTSSSIDSIKPLAWPSTYACENTLSFCNRFGIPEKTDTPLNRSIQCIRSDLLNFAALPIREITQIPYLTKKCIVILSQRLNFPFSLGDYCVAPINWFLHLKALSQGEDWIYWDTILVGSALPMCSDFWSQMLKLYAILKPELHDSYLQTLNKTGHSWRNLDALIRVQLGPREDSRERVEAAVMQALLNIVGNNINTNELQSAIKGRARIGNLGTVFTIGNEKYSFDLMVLYTSYEQGLPELFTQQDLCLRIDHLLSIPSENWSHYCPYLSPQTIGISLSQLLMDRAINIIRYQPRFCNGIEENFGLFKKLMVMKLKGGLGVQKGLEEWTLKIYLHNRRQVKCANYDADQSYREHLSDSFGTFLAHRMHWIEAMRKMGNQEMQRNLAQQFDYPLNESTPNYQKQTVNFLKRYPQRFQMLLTGLEFSMLLSYLKSPGVLVSSGMWDGQLSMRLRMENHLESYFQIRFNPVACVKKMQRLLGENQIDLQIKAAWKELLFSYFDFFEIEGINHDQEAIKFVRAMGFDETMIEQIIQQLDTPASSAETSQSHTCPEIPNSEPITSVFDTRIVPIRELVENKDWDTLARRLISLAKKGISEKRIMPLGEYLWQLFEEWSNSWKNEYRSLMLVLVKRYCHSLKMTTNGTRSALFCHLIRNGFKVERQLRILLEHEQSELGIINRNHLNDFLNQKLTQCCDQPTLLSFYRYFPEFTTDYALRSLSSTPLPSLENFKSLVLFIKETDQVNKFSELEIKLAQQLIIEKRFTELYLIDNHAHIAHVFESSFHLSIQDRTFENARLLLIQWKLYSRQDQDDWELELLQAEAINPRLQILKEAMDLWRKHQNKRDEVCARSSSLCLKLIINGPHTDLKTTKALWKLIKTLNLQKFPVSFWLIVFEKMKGCRDYTDLWEAFDLFMNHSSHWDTAFEEIFYHLLEQRKALNARNLFLLSIIPKLGGRALSNSKNHSTNQFCLLIIKNLVEMANNAKPKERRETSLYMCEKLIIAVRYFDLSPIERQTLAQLQGMLNGNLKGINVIVPHNQFSPLPSVSVLGRYSFRKIIIFTTLISVVVIVAYKFFLYVQKNPNMEVFVRVASENLEMVCPYGHIGERCVINFLKSTS